MIHKDGSATAEIGGYGAMSDFRIERSQDFPPGTIDTKALLSLLTEIGDVSRIPTGPCPKSISLGTTTKISYAGRTSGDLQSIPQYTSGGDPALLQAGENLWKFVQKTESQLPIRAMRASSNQFG